MTRFIPLIDNNNKTVLQWTMIDSNGVEIVKSIPKTLWKIEADWSEDEIRNLFNTLQTTETATAQEVVEVLKEVEEAFVFEDQPEPEVSELEKRSFLNLLNR
jgi:hypothetical protein